MTPLWIFAASCATAGAIQNGLARTPPMGFNSWMAAGTGISEAYFLDIASFFNSSGLQAAGYNYICSDGGSASQAFVSRGMA